MSRETINSRRNDMLGVIAVFVLLIGTASNNAYVMAGLSLAGLILLPLFCPKQSRSGAILVAFTAAVGATVIAATLTMR